MPFPPATDNNLSLPFSSPLDTPVFHVNVIFLPLFCPLSYALRTSTSRGHLGSAAFFVFFANTSAASLPRMPMWAFTHPILTSIPSSLIFAISLTIFCRCRDLAFPVLPALFSPPQSPSSDMGPQRSLPSGRMLTMRVVTEEV